MTKSLKDMTLEELWQLFPIILKEHNSDYQNWYSEEKTDLDNIFDGKVIKRINHIGSTAVKGLIAKPIIDILLEVADDTSVDWLIEQLENAGWILMSKADNPLKLAFNKGYTSEGFAERVYHLHVRHLGDWDELYFRDYLNECPDIKKEYEVLKLSLKEQYEHDRDAYTEAKTVFIQEQTKKARKTFGKRYQRVESQLKSIRLQEASTGKLKRYLMIAGAVIGSLIPITIELVDFFKTASLDGSVYTLFDFYIRDVKAFIVKTIILTGFGAVGAWYGYEKFVWAEKVYERR